MLVDNIPRLTYDDVILVPGYSEAPSRSDDYISIATTLGRERLSIPIISSNMDSITGMSMAEEMAFMGGLGVVHRGDPDPETAIRSYISRWARTGYTYKLALSVGSINRPLEMARIDAIFKHGLDLIEQDRLIVCADIAHGHSKNMVETLRHLRNERGFKGTIIAGSVCTPEGTLCLSDAGADAVRVGIGPGSACTTRLKTGCGYPQLSAVYECSRTGVPVIADGGIREPGDAAKALAAGASAVMIGGMLKGTDKTPFWKGFGQQVVFRGMASNAAKTSVGIAPGYEEGISTQVIGQEEGSTERVVKTICDGVRSAISYIGATSIPEFREMARFVRVTSGCLNENKPHSIL